MLPSPSLRTVCSEVLGFMLAASCPGCARPETLLCDACREAISPSPIELRTPAGLRVLAAMPFDSVAARCIRRLKDEGETLLARPLGAALGAVLAGELESAGSPTPVVVPVPTTRRAFRRRGYRVPELLIRRAGSTPHRVLALQRTSADQRGLGVERRVENVRGTMRSRVSGGGAPVVLVDDVVTTGATFDEAARSLGAAGFRLVSAVALAATPRHSEQNANASGTRRK